MSIVDGAKHWHKLGGGVPTISFRDIEIHSRETDLAGVSFGCGLFVLNDYSPLRQIDEIAADRFGAVLGRLRGLIERDLRGLPVWTR
jgi:hypothetical protein